jgi:hypothetical protein
VEHSGVERGGKEVVGSGYGVDVSRQVEVELKGEGRGRGKGKDEGGAKGRARKGEAGEAGRSACEELKEGERKGKTHLSHGDNLRVTSSGSSTLDTEGGTLRRLSDTGERGLAEVSSKLEGSKIAEEMSAVVWIDASSERVYIVLTA